mmetsp:Transcript_40556/g.107170  ORF Transcript_40556/g.107170 Transcript_40556/m.107170 type:complete len:98 (+) Transcript_40556:3-296(+)
MALRLQLHQEEGGQSRPLPGSARFWRELSPAPSRHARRDAAPSLAELSAAGVTVAEAADLLLEARAAAILDRVAELIRANGDGAALSALIARAGGGQ